MAVSLPLRRFRCKLLAVDIDAIGGRIDMGDDDKLEVNAPNTEEPPRETVRPRGRYEYDDRRGHARSDTARDAGRDRVYRPASQGDSSKPVIIAALYISSLLVGLTGLVAFILALVWKSEPHQAWESSHYDYHVLTFIVWLVETVVAIALIFTLIGALIGIPLLFVAYVQVLVRGIVSLSRATNREPMPNPGTWLV
jgi:uncharacterized membrane protein